MTKLSNPLKTILVIPTMVSVTENLVQGRKRKRQRKVHLHPTFTTAQKARRIAETCKEIAQREKDAQETKQQGARKSKTFAEEKKAKAELDKQLGYTKKPKNTGYTSDKSVSSVHKNVSKRRGRPPRSARKEEKRSPANKFSSFMLLIHKKK